MAATLLAFFAFMLSGAVKCAFAVMTHHPCPTCGGTRSVRALLSLDLATALRFNPIAPVIFLIMGAIATRGVWMVARDGTAEGIGQGTMGKWLLRALVWALVLDIVVWALRFFGLFGGPVPV